jgi:hypothetical protein
LDTPRVARPCSAWRWTSSAAWRSSLEALDPVAEWVFGVEALEAFQRLVGDCRIARIDEAAAENLQALEINAGWAFGAATNCFSTPRWISTVDDRNQQPPRRSRFAVLATRGMPSRPD